MVNNINGSNLMELDRSHLRDMGIKKLGDQIRIASQAKKFRDKETHRISKRNTNRVRTEFTLHSKEIDTNTTSRNR